MFTQSLLRLMFACVCASASTAPCPDALVLANVGSLTIRTGTLETTMLKPSTAFAFNASTAVCFPDGVQVRIQ